MKAQIKLKIKCCRSTTLLVTLQLLFLWYSICPATEKYTCCQTPSELLFFLKKKSLIHIQSEKKTIDVIPHNPTNPICNLYLSTVLWRQTILLTGFWSTSLICAPGAVQQTTYCISKQRRAATQFGLLSLLVWKAKFWILAHT